MPLTPEDVRNKQFTTVRLREGYDEDEVDAFLDEVEAELTRLLRENEDLRAKLAAATRAAAQNQQQGMRKPPEQQDQQQQQGEQQVHSSALFNQQGQPLFDTTFQSLVGSVGSYAGQVDWQREYFDLAEQQIRSARRVAELQTIGLMRQQIVTEAASAVISALRQNPQMLQQIASSGSGGSRSNSSR